MPQQTEQERPLRPLILASGSSARRVLLERLGLAFSIAAPDIDEAPLPGETPRALVTRLARQKAEAVARHERQALLIGSDQVAVNGAAVLGKPLGHERAVAQLTAASGGDVRFLTGVCVLDAATGAAETHVDETIVTFRALSDEEIERYVRRETPYECAGSFKSEGLGIALFERVRSLDPAALQGLPLIWLSAALRRAGVRVI